MKEICIVLEKKLNLKYDKLIVKLKNFKCIVIKLNQQNDVKLVIAYNDTNSFEVENLIKNYLKNIVLKTFKQNFIKNNMKLSHSVKDKILISSLVNYDFDADEIYFLKKIDLSKDLYISSFINFKMQIMINKWKDIIELTKTNMSILDCDSVYFSLIRYLNDNGTIASKNIVATNFKRNLIRYKNKIFKVKDFMCYCIANYPNKIQISYSGDNLQYKETLSKVFEKKIDFIFTKQLTTNENNCTI